MSVSGSIRIFGRSVSWWVLAVALAALVAGLIGLALSAREAPRFTVSTQTLDVGDAPQDVDVRGSAVWVVNGGDQTAQPIAAGDTTEGGSAKELGTLPGEIAITEDAIWVGAIQGNEVHRIAADRVRTVPVGETPQSIAAGTDAVWVASFDEGSIWKIRMEGDRPVTESFELEDAFPSAIAVGHGSVWIADVVANKVIRMDEVTGMVTREIPVGDSPTALAVGEDAVWVVNYNDATVTHIDPSTNEQVGQPIIVGGRPGGIAVGEGSVWVTRPESDSVIRIDPVESEWTGEVFAVGDGPQGIAAGAGSIWTADQGSDTVTRLTPTSAP